MRLLRPTMMPRMMPMRAPARGPFIGMRGMRERPVAAPATEGGGAWGIIGGFLGLFGRLIFSTGTQIQSPSNWFTIVIKEV